MTSRRYFQTPPIPVSLYERIARAVHLKGGNVGQAVYGAMRAVHRELPPMPDVRYTIHRVPLVAGMVVKVYPGAQVFAQIDHRMSVDMFATPADLQERVMAELRRQYAMIDTQQTRINAT